MKSFITAVSFSILGLSLIAQAEGLKLAPVFQEHMVLQREKPVHVWGQAGSGQDVTVTVAGKSAKGKSGADGKWSVTLPELPTGGPYEFTASSGSDKIEFKDVLVGEVWICAGQDNMIMTYKNMRAPQELIDDMLQRPIRSLRLNLRLSLEPSEAISGEWKKEHCRSAVGFYLSNELQKELDVPFAIIETTCNSSPIEAWMPEKFTNKLPHFKEVVDKFKNGEAAKLQSKIEGVKGEELDYKSSKKLKSLYGKPTLVHNAMIHPLAPYTVRGMVWYQGESNASRSMEESQRYGDLLKMWINYLREIWKDPDMHFHAVMLTRMGLITQSSPTKDLSAPNAHSWAWFREAQQKILSLPNTAVINTIDGGQNPKILHPKDKDKIGRRAALMKLNLIHGKDVTYLGPIMEEVKIGETSTTITYKHAQGLKTTDGKAPQEFWVAGKDRKWVQAAAKIEGDTIVLTHPSNMKVDAVRYAFSAYPKVNLINGADLPAYPFRSDDDTP